MTRSAGALILTPLMALTLLLSGCGGDSDPDTASPSTASADAGSGQTGGAGVPGGISEEFQQCLEDQGVELPSGQPEQGSAPSPDAELQDAFAQCASLAPSDAPGGAGAVDQTALDAFADCMKDNGVRVDASLRAISELDEDRPAVRAALRTCSPLIQPGS